MEFSFNKDMRSLPDLPAILDCPTIFFYSGFYNIKTITKLSVYVRLYCEKYRTFIRFYLFTKGFYLVGQIGNPCDYYRLI